MIGPKAPKRLIPLSPTLPVHDAATPRKWAIRPSFGPLDRSQSRMLQFLRAEIAIDREGAPVIILDVKCYEADPSASCVKILLGNVGFKTRVQPAECGEGITNVWAAVPGAALKEGLAVTLQVLSEDLVRGQLVIGIVHIASALNTTQPFGGNRTTRFQPQSIFQTPTTPIIAANDDKAANEVPFIAPEHDNSILPSDDLPPDYQRLCLSVVGDLDLVVEDWKPPEEKAGRRLVRFWREQSGSLVKLRFATHSLLDPYREKSQMVISCISLPDHEGRWVTSFDIVRLAAYILQIPLNTEMKNRARRNMASVECKTLLRVIANENSKTEAFTTIMQFEDPKPRSIEKSIKIYKWDVLKTCLSKILQRFIIYLPDIPTGPVEFEHQLEAVNRWKRSRRSNASTRLPKTRKDVYVPTFIDQDDNPKTKRMTRRSQSSNAQKLEKVLSEYEPLNTPDTALKQEAQNLTQVSPKAQYEEGADLNQDPEVPSSSYQTHQPLSVQTTGSPLVATALAVDSNPEIQSPATSIDTTQPSYQRLIHPSLQSSLSPSSLTIVHHDWTAPSHSEGIGNTVLPSPTGTFASSFDSYSPLHSNSPSPRFFLADSDDIYHQQYSQYSVSSYSSDGYLPDASHPGMASTSTLVTPTHSDFDPYMYASNRSSEVTLVEQSPDFDFHQQPSTPVGPPHSPALGGISFNPYYPPYTVEGDHMLQLQTLSQGSLAVDQVKEEEKEIDTDEWLNNDYIMSQENNYTG